jgi:hypothetical protein
MSLKNKIVAGFLLYWVYELYRYRRRMGLPVDRFRFPDF